VLDVFCVRTINPRQKDENLENQSAFITLKNINRTLQDENTMLNESNESLNFTIMDLNLRIAHLKECDLPLGDKMETSPGTEKEEAQIFSKKRSRSLEDDELKEGSDAIPEEEVKKKRKNTRSNSKARESLKDSSEEK